MWDTLAIAEYLNKLRLTTHMPPRGRAAHARCRSIAGEMHFGFSALRASLPMNLRAVRRGFIVWAAQADIDRIIEKPTVCRRLGQRR
jgi:glutathione S-transferase